jgi:catechol 2,3-dioxygenase-like lactoylglutathione lyase family enzyme
VVKTHGLTHIALAVQDAERSFAFYRDVFGMVLVYRENGFIQVQTPAAETSWCSKRPTGASPARAGSPISGSG